MKYRIAKIETFQAGDINFLSTNIYFDKCNNKCPYCHNPELQCGCEGRTWTLHDIVATCVTEWVCLMGGDPIHSMDSMQFGTLVDALHSAGKKVCVFSSEFHPNLVSDVDHWHWHITKRSDWARVVDVRSFAVDRLSISYVSFDTFSVNTFAKWMLDVPVYVREAIGYEEYSNPHKNANALRLAGFKTVYDDGEKINVL